MDTELHLGSEAIARFQDGLMAAVLGHDPQGNLGCKSGVMGVVVRGGIVAPGDAIEVVLPAGEPRTLEKV